MVTQFPCKICCKPVATNHKSIKCDKCDIWIHTECNRINKQTYEMLKKDSSQWFCIVCMKELFPFSNLNDKDLLQQHSVNRSNLQVFQKNEILTKQYSQT